MAIERWCPRESLTKQEEWLMSRLTRNRKLFAFLRRHRKTLFNEAFQQELETMYRITRAGKAPLPPALMAMAVLLQGYMGVSDAEAVELTVIDLRWQLVLDRLGETDPPFSQGALCDFRNRMILTGMDRRLLEKTVEVAKQTKEFDPRKLPKKVHLAIDSAPLEGAGKVEDTINLLGHAARKIVSCSASILQCSYADIAKRAGIPLLLESSTKKALDIDWNDTEQKRDALQRLIDQITSLQKWVEKCLPLALKMLPLSNEIEALQQVIDQDLEPDPNNLSGKIMQIRKGVAKDRRVSIEDKQMGHGRKSKSKKFNGYKRHIATDLNTQLIIACALTVANRPEGEAQPDLKEDIQRQGVVIGELNIDRGYINGILVDEVLSGVGEIICRPWAAKNKDLYPKSSFDINIEEMTVTCPAGHSESFRLGSVVRFDPETCTNCPLRSHCTSAAPGRGRTISISKKEPLQQELRELTNTSEGRQKLRKRVAVEHRLSHVIRKQGRRARYIGIRKNLYDLRRAATINNLETLNRKSPDLQLANAA